MILVLASLLAVVLAACVWAGCTAARTARDERAARRLAFMRTYRSEEGMADIYARSDR